MKITAILIGLLTLLLVAPASAANKVGTHRNIDTSFDNARLILGNDGLYGKVKFTKARVKPRGKFVKGNVEVQNLTDARMELEYRFDWQDEDGFRVGEAGIWQRFALGPRGIRSFKSMGKDKEAAKIQFMLRYLGDSVIINTQTQDQEKH
jgi:uncharacterized protein YcfL